MRCKSSFTLCAKSKKLSLKVVLIKEWITLSAISAVDNTLCYQQWITLSAISYILSAILAKSKEKTHSLLLLAKTADLCC